MSDFIKDWKETNKGEHTRYLLQVALMAMFCGFGIFCSILFLASSDYLMALAALGFIALMWCALLIPWRDK